MLRKLKAALLFLRSSKWVEQPEWTTEDEERLSAFLKSETGRKLKATLLNLTLTYNAQAVRSEKNLAQSCGWASGFAGAVATLESLGQPKIYEAEPEGDDDSDLERYRP